MTTSTLNTITCNELDAEATEIAWTLVQNEHAVNQAIDGAGVIYEFPKQESIEEFTEAAIDFINRCTDHTAETVDEPRTLNSVEWSSGIAYLPVIEVRFEDGLQVEGMLVTDKNGRPVGVIVTDCDDNEKDIFKGELLRF